VKAVSPQFEIRKASEEDCVLVTELIRRSFQDVAIRFGLTAENCPKHPSNCAVEWIKADMDQGATYFVSEDQGTAAGCVGLERKDSSTCYLKRLAVLPEHRRKGFGAALVNRVLTEALSLDVARVDIGVIADHTDLKRWYVRLGFVELETKHFPHLPFAVTFMTRDLGK
jgi:N-acetylglutamate synthase-like GNAT family acetyltransferase